MISLKKISINNLFSIFLLLLATSGLWNFIFGGTPLVAWKQIIIFLTYALIARLKKDRFSSALLYLILFVQFLLILTSSIRGVSPFVILFNIFFYTAWLPFFLWSAQGGNDYFNKNYSRSTLILLVVSAAGLYIDLKTDYLSFLSNTGVGFDYYQDFDVAKRSAFVFVTSTLVMPIVGALAVMALTQEYSIFRLIVCIFVILIATVSTASASAFLISIFVVIGIFVNNIRLSRVIVFLVGGVFVLLLGQGLIAKDDVLLRQIDRIVNNKNVQNESNSGRLASWDKAANVIQKFSPIEHAVGLGLGATNDNNNASARYTHGESSFFQAYIESGVTGLFLRLLPFALIVFFALRTRNKNKFLVLSYCAAIFVAVALAPIFGNIPSQALLGFLAGSLYKSHRSERYLQSSAYAVR